MKFPTYSFASISVGGKLLEDFVDLRWYKSPALEAVERPMPSRISLGSVELVSDGFDWKALVFRFSPNLRGVTPLTLLRRVGYGGRKGRSAARRLRALVRYS